MDTQFKVGDQVTINDHDLSPLMVKFTIGKPYTVTEVVGDKALYIRDDIGTLRFRYFYEVTKVEPPTTIFKVDDYVRFPHTKAGEVSRENIYRINGFNNEGSIGFVDDAGTQRYWNPSRAQLADQPEIVEVVAEALQCDPEKYAPEPVTEPAPTSIVDTQVGGNHYTSMAIQPITFVMANGIPFAEGNVIKYISRWRKKNGLQDLKKAAHMLSVIIEQVEAGEYK